MTYPEYVANPNTKLLLHLNGNSNDSSGNSNNGTDTNITYSVANGIVGQGAGFTSSSFITFPNLNIGTNNCTYIMWVNPSTFVDYRRYFYSGNGSNQELSMHQLPTNSIGFLVNHYNGTNDVNISIPTSNIPTNQYSMIAFTRNGDIGSIYMNGKQTTSNTGWNGRNFNGTIYQSLGLTGGSTFEGVMDEVIIEDRAWSEQEVRNYYNMTKGYFAPKII